MKSEVLQKYTIGRFFKDNLGNISNKSSFNTKKILV